MLCELGQAQQREPWLVDLVQIRARVDRQSRCKVENAAQIPSPGQLNLKTKQLDRSLDPISRAPFTKQGQFPPFVFELSSWPSEICDVRDLFQAMG